MDKNKSFFETTSLVLASTLVCSKIPLNSVIKGRDGKSTFAFTKTNNLDQVISDFWQRSLKVEPNSFWESIRFCKSRIYGD